MAKHNPSSGELIEFDTGTLGAVFSKAYAEDRQKGALCDKNRAVDSAVEAKQFSEIFLKNNGSLFGSFTINIVYIQSQRRSPRKHEVGRFFFWGGGSQRSSEV